LINSTFGPSHDSAQLSATAINSVDFILYSSVFAEVFLYNRLLLTFDGDFSYATKCEE